MFEKACALLIGISEYRHPAIKWLNFVRKDVEALHDVLLDNGWREYNILTVLYESATLAGIRHGLTSLVRKVEEVDPNLVIVFISGHGKADKTSGEAYLLPYDADIDFLPHTAVPYTDLKERLPQLKNGLVICFFDAGASGVKPARVADAFEPYPGNIYEQLADYTGASGVKLPARTVDTFEPYTHNIYEQLADSGRIIMASCRHDQLAYEDEELGHGIFTYHLLEVLRGDAGFDEETGYVDYLTIQRHLQKKVPESCRKLRARLHAKGITLPIIEQTPTFEVKLPVGMSIPLAPGRSRQEKFNRSYP